MKKKVLIIIGIILVLAVSAPCLYFLGGLVLREIYYIKDVKGWKENASPISEKVAQDVCQKLEIPANDWRCQNGAVVYAPDFFGEINDWFTPSETNHVTIDNINSVLGEYLYHTEPLVKQSDGFEYYVVWYDLNTDHMYPIVVFVEKDGDVFRLIATVVH